jgi:hypothetical protein
MFFESSGLFGSVFCAGLCSAGRVLAGAPLQVLPPVEGLASYYVMGDKKGNRWEADGPEHL